MVPENFENLATSSLFYVVFPTMVLDLYYCSGNESHCPLQNTTEAFYVLPFKNSIMPVVNQIDEVINKGV